MAKTDKRQNQATDEKKNETQSQTVENQQPENPAQADSGNGDTQPTVTQQTETPASSETPPADNADKDGNASEQPKDGNAEKKAESDAAKKTVKMVLKHKSHTPHYHRCGLMLTKVFAEYEVSEEAVAKIKADKWIEVKGSK